MSFNINRFDQKRFLPKILVTHFVVDVYTIYEIFIILQLLISFYFRVIKLLNCCIILRNPLNPTISNVYIKSNFILSSILFLKLYLQCQIMPIVLLFLGIWGWLANIRLNGSKCQTRSWRIRFQTLPAATSGSYFFSQYVVGTA